MSHEEINALIKEHGVDTNKISDGYHTFGELYDHRIALWIALCKRIKNSMSIYGPDVWRSIYHSDGTTFNGWFVLGITAFGSKEQVTYHLPMKFWDKTAFANTLEKAPEFDGHTSADVIERLMRSPY